MAQALRTQMGRETFLDDSKRPKCIGKLSHNVYVIELSEDVLSLKKFREANPDYVEGKACVYVGMTGLTPDQRFENHKKGHKSGKGYVKKYGKWLRRKLYEKYNPMSHDDACSKEIELANVLRRKGYGVWQN